MTENKTRPTTKNVQEFLNGIDDSRRREDCVEIAAMMKELTGSAPRMWGDSIVGFGDYHYKYASGREGDWFQVGFSPRKQNLTIYIMGYLEAYEKLLGNLGKFKHGKGCLYIKTLDDVNRDVLKSLLEKSIDGLQKP